MYSFALKTGHYIIILLVFYCQDSQPGVNQWGENPNRYAKINLPTINSLFLML